MPPRPIEDSSFTVVANGFADGPAQALRDYLISRRARGVTTIFHPLVPEDGGRHEIHHWAGGEHTGSRVVRLPSRPPLTYPLDLVVPPWPRATDAWLGFNGLACARGVAARAAGRAGVVVYWCVDYVEERFGLGLLTRAYTAVDRFCCTRSDLRIELSEPARQARDARHAAALGRLAPAVVVPMGAWLARVPTTLEDGVAAHRLAYLGHLVPRQGIATLIRALGLLHARGVEVGADIVGRGPLEHELRGLALQLGIEGSVVFHGFVPDHREVERILASAAIGAAPYVDSVESFTRFADPGKLKAYLAAGLPIVTTAVSPNALDLAAAGAAMLVEDDPVALAAAIERLLGDPAEWRRRRHASLRLAQEYDWEQLLPAGLERVGFV